MRSEVLLRPGVELGPYPERLPTRRDALEAALMRAVDILRPRPSAFRAEQERFLARVETLGSALEDMAPNGVRAVLKDLRAALPARGLDDEMLAKCFAITREVSGRVLGMRHYPTQLAGGWVIASGMLAELDTGEGKTLCATLPACAAAVAGVPVHVITANDYLARRDAAQMGPLYRAMGLTVGVAGEGESHEKRQRAYACDVTYCTAKQLAFDYLQDRLMRGGASHRWQLQVERLRGDASRHRRLLLRGLCFAIVDEADSILIDEAKTPLILSRTLPAAQETAVYDRAHALADGLKPREDYVVDEVDGRVRFTSAGRARLAEGAASVGGVFAAARQREHLVHQALTARLLFHRDRDYIVRDERVIIVDRNTGRPMPDRSWEAGLHQMVEVKEGCPVTGVRETIARTTYQRFFQRYLRVGGMTGTAREVAGELKAVYRLQVARVEPHRPCRRAAYGVSVHLCREAKWRRIADRTAALAAQGRPVLIGTRSVEESEALSAHLDEAGIEHQVLNARQDREEAAIVARAGEPGCVTVATNMAGRGTDIKLAPGVAQRGGLHVIVAECNDARRIDRQLIGRAARQGDPGSYEQILSVDDFLVQRFGPRALRAAGAILARNDERLPTRVGLHIVRRAQRRVEHQHTTARRAVLRMDEFLADTLSFAGVAE